MGEDKNSKLISDTGRIVLPIEVRPAMDWDKKTPVEIWLNATDHEVVIKRHLFTCAYCGATENLKQYQKLHLCPNCQREIAVL